MMHLSTKPPEIYNFVHTFAKLFMRLTFVIFPIGCHYFSCLTNASPFIFCPYYSTILEIPNKHFDSYQRQSKKNSFSFRNIHIHESKGVDIHYPVHGMIEWENPIPKLKRRPHAKRVLSRFPIRCFVWPTFENPVAAANQTCHQILISSHPWQLMLFASFNISFEIAWQQTLKCAHIYQTSWIVGRWPLTSPYRDSVEQWNYFQIWGSVFVNLLKRFLFWFFFGISPPVKMISPPALPK